MYILLPSNSQRHCVQVVGTRIIELCGQVTLTHVNLENIDGENGY